MPTWRRNKKIGQQRLRKTSRLSHKRTEQGWTETNSLPDEITKAIETTLYILHYVYIGLVWQDPEGTVATHWSLTAPLKTATTTRSLNGQNMPEVERIESGSNSKQWSNNQTNKEPCTGGEQQKSGKARIKPGKENYGSRAMIRLEEAPHL